MSSSPLKVPVDFSFEQCQLRHGFTAAEKNAEDSHVAMPTAHGDRGDCLLLLRSIAERLSNTTLDDAHYVDIIVRRNGESTRFEGDWLKNLHYILNREREE